jgi:hydrogenase maturation protease
LTDRHQPPVDSRRKSFRLGPPPNIVVAGLGNLLLTDDGAGIHVVRAMAGRNWPGHVQLLDVGTAVLDAVPWIEWADVILAVDAMQAGGAPGTLYRFGLADVAGPGQSISLHDVNFVSVMPFTRRTVPPRIVVLGIEPARIEFGMDLSPPVAAVLPAAVDAATAMVEELVEQAGMLAVLNGARAVSGG